ncbi:MAG TPA: hypothetical protein VE046_08840 [Steroidobacteraceae bacterium]|nr:hypothetical protein [Steroidobacteraceae bacterium]
MTNLPELTSRIETIESGYEYLLAYAAQGRQSDEGSEVRRSLEDMAAALDGLGALVVSAVGGVAVHGRPDTAEFLAAVGHDARLARGAIGLVMSRPAISSLLVDNLNASVHLRALLTDLFLVDQALK